MPEMSEKTMGADTSGAKQTALASSINTTMANLQENAATLRKGHKSASSANAGSRRTVCPEKVGDGASPSQPARDAKSTDRQSARMTPQEARIAALATMCVIK
ncbi:hypothetical protein AAL_03978 [Moelleriella libera RCEF 2490]|uniref:Uncharacterized protein n=1 Tax=Moelleriella libera RCEF 2490 TaxID=1081109 RepID=A0A168CLG5_9HYPO|nr:hypothetical protein AAL_03978 [Moelleriella libera RCEF 2490]